MGGVGWRMSRPVISSKKSWEGARVGFGIDEGCPLSSRSSLAQHALSSGVDSVRAWTSFLTAFSDIYLSLNKLFRSSPPSRTPAPAQHLSIPQSSYDNQPSPMHSTKRSIGRRQQQRPQNGRQPSPLAVAAKYLRMVVWKLRHDFDGTVTGISRATCRSTSRCRRPRMSAYRLDFVGDPRMVSP